MPGKYTHTETNPSESTAQPFIKEDSNDDEASDVNADEEEPLDEDELDQADIAIRRAWGETL